MARFNARESMEMQTQRYEIIPRSNLWGFGFPVKFRKFGPYIKSTSASMRSTRYVDNLVIETFRIKGWGYLSRPYQFVKIHDYRNTWVRRKKVIINEITTQEK